LVAASPGFSGVCAAGFFAAAVFGESLCCAKEEGMKVNKTAKKAADMRKADFMLPSSRGLISSVLRVREIVHRLGPAIGEPLADGLELVEFTQKKPGIVLRRPARCEARLLLLCDLRDFVRG
jgi:hypothetical protein